MLLNSRQEVSRVENLKITSRVWMFSFLQCSPAWEGVMGTPNKQWEAASVSEVGLDQSSCLETPCKEANKEEDRERATLTSLDPQS